MPLPGDITALKAQIHTDITTQTGFHAVTHDIHGNDMEAICDLMVDIFSAIVASGGLQSVLNISNSATNSGAVGIIHLINSPTNFQDLQLAPGQIFFTNAGGSPSLALFNSTTPTITIYNGGGIQFYAATGGFLSTVSPSVFTGNRGVLIPDEGNGIGIESTLVTHITKDDIQVNPDGVHKATLALSQIKIEDSTAQAWLKTTDVTLKDAGGASIGFQLNSGVPTLSIFRPGTGFEADFTAGTITASRNFTPPNRSGTLQISGDGVSPTIVLGTGAGTGATFTISSGSDDRSGIITVVFGTSPVNNGHIAVVTFHIPYPLPVRVILGAANAATAPDIAAGVYCSNGAAATFVIEAIGIHAAGTYAYTYIVQN